MASTTENSIPASEIDAASEDPQVKQEALPEMLDSEEQPDAGNAGAANENEFLDSVWVEAEEKLLAAKYGGNYFKVVYNEEQHRPAYMCEVCDSELNTKKIIEAHCGGARHKRRIEEVESLKALGLPWKRPDRVWGYGYENTFLRKKKKKEVVGRILKMQDKDDDEEQIFEEEYEEPGSFDGPPMGPFPGSPFMGRMRGSGPRMGPFGGPGIRPFGPRMGPRGFHPRMGLGPRGFFRGPRPFWGPRGPHPHMGPDGPMGPCGLMRPGGPHIGPRGPHIGPRGPHMGLKGPHTGLRGPHTSPSGSHMGPDGPHMGPDGPHMGPDGPHMGPEGPMRPGPHREFDSAMQVSEDAKQMVGHGAEGSKSGAGGGEPQQEGEQTAPGAPPAAATAGSRHVEGPGRKRSRFSSDTEMERDSPPVAPPGETGPPGETEPSGTSSSAGPESQGKTYQNPGDSGGGSGPGGSGKPCGPPSFSGPSFQVGQYGSGSQAARRPDQGNIVPSFPPPKSQFDSIISQQSSNNNNNNNTNAALNGSHFKQEGVNGHFKMENYVEGSQMFHDVRNKHGLPPSSSSESTQEPEDSKVQITVDEECLAGGGSTGILLKKLAGCVIKDEKDAELALNVSNSLVSSLREHYIKKGELKVGELLMTAELKLNTLRAMKVGLKLLDKELLKMNDAPQPTTSSNNVYTAQPDNRALLSASNLGYFAPPQPSPTLAAATAASAVSYANIGQSSQHSYSYVNRPPGVNSSAVTNGSAVDAATAAVISIPPPSSIQGQSSLSTDTSVPPPSSSSTSTVPSPYSTQPPTTSGSITTTFSGSAYGGYSTSNSPSAQQPPAPHSYSSSNTGYSQYSAPLAAAGGGASYYSNQQPYIGYSTAAPAYPPTYGMQAAGAGYGTSAADSASQVYHFSVPPPSATPQQQPPPY